MKPLTKEDKAIVDNLDLLQSMELFESADVYDMIENLEDLGDPEGKDPTDAAELNADGEDE